MMNPGVYTERFKSFEESQVWEKINDHVTLNQDSNYQVVNNSKWLHSSTTDNTWGGGTYTNKTQQQQNAQSTILHKKGTTPA